MLTPVGIDSAETVVCRVGSRLCAIPLEHVVETMRPLPVEVIAGTPAFVLGAAVVRGVPVPVVDARRLFQDVGVASPAGRFVTLRIGTRAVALAVDAVVGIRSLPKAAHAELPPLLREADPGVVSSIGALDDRLLVVLRAARIVPHPVWTALAGREDHA